MKSFKKLFVIVLTVLISITSCEKDELLGIFKYDSRSSNIDRWCTSLYFQSETVGYATTQEGEVFKTIDGGESWISLNLSSPVPLRTIFFVNNDIGYVFGGKSECSPSPCEPYGSIVYKTTNGGDSWKKQNVPYEWSELYSAYFFNENNGFAVGKGLSIKTTNGGNTWKSFRNEKSSFTKISFLNQKDGYALGLIGGFFKTVDGGQSWKEINVNNEKRTFNFYFINETIGYVNNSNKLFKTTDGGNSWNLINTIESVGNYIYFVNENLGIVLSKKYLNDSRNWSISSGQKIHIVNITKDGGQTWATTELEDSELNERCLFSKDNIVYSLHPNKIIKLVIE